MGKFDAIIIGAGLAGLSVAARLGKIGKRVAILDPASAAGGNAMDISLDGVRFPAGPASIYGFEPGGPLRTLCSELGITLNLLPEMKAYQVVLPDRRVTVFPDSETAFEEMRREFPREIDVIRKLRKDLRTLYDAAGRSPVKAYFARRRSARDYLSSFRLSRELGAFYNVQSLVYFGKPLSELRLDSLALMVSAFPQSARDGVSGIASSLEKHISGSGGTIRLNEPWPEVITRSRMITGVAASSGVMDARTVIINTPEAGTERRWLLGIKPDVIPVGMLDTVLCLPDYDKPLDVMTLTISGSDDVRAANVARALRVSFYGRDQQNFTAEILLDRICAVIPFLRDFIDMGGEDDLSALSYPAKKLPSHTPAGVSGRLIADACSRLKHIIFIPDSSLGIGESVNDARRLAKRIA